MAIGLCLVYSSLWVFRPLRVGPDTISYYRAYEDSLGFGYPSTNTFEPGFNFLISFSKALGFPFELFQFVCLLLISLLFFLAYRIAVKNYLFATAATLLSPFYSSLSLNILRQGVAAGFLAVAFASFVAGRKVSGTILFLVAGSMHVTAYAFAAFLLPALLVHRVSLLLVIFSCIFAVILGFVANNLEGARVIFEHAGIEGKPVRRLNTYISDPTSTSVGISTSLDIVLLILFYKVLKSGRVFRWQNFPFDLVGVYSKYFTVALCGIIFYIIFSDYAVLARIAVYTYFSGVILVSYFLACSNVSPKAVFAYLFLFVVWAKLGVGLYGRGDFIFFI